MLIDYVFRQPGQIEQLTLTQNCLYRYLVGQEGVFLETHRRGLKTCLPLAPCEIRGLAAVNSYFQLEYPPVPKELLSQMLELARQAETAAGTPAEILFYLLWQEQGGFWEMILPDQKGRASSVRPTDPTNLEYQAALIEVHSHNSMAAFFSATDDQDEQGLKLYGVLGKIFDEPQIALRLGVYGQFFPVPASLVFNLPEGLEDALFAGFETAEKEGL